MNDKEIKLDIQLWNAQLNEQFDVASAADYNPTREEFIQIVKYWAQEVLEVQYFQFGTGQYCGRDSRLIRFARERCDRIAEVLGQEAVYQAIDEVYAKFGEKQDQTIWNIFLNGTKEQWDAVQMETHKALEEAQEENEK